MSVGSVQGGTGRGREKKRAMMIALAVWWAGVRSEPGKAEVFHLSSSRTRLGRVEWCSVENTVSL